MHCYHVKWIHKYVLFLQTLEPLPSAELHFEGDSSAGVDVAAAREKTADTEHVELAFENLQLPLLSVIAESLRKHVDLLKYPLKQTLGM